MAPAQELWKYDGTTKSLAADINPGDGGSAPHGFTIYNNELYFAALGSSKVGSELWKFDGTSATLVADLDTTDFTSSAPSELTVFNNKLYFNARHYIQNHLWIYDGVKAKVAAWPCPTGYPLYGPDPHDLTVYAGALYLSGEDCADGRGTELWKLNDKDQITLVGDIWPGSHSSYPYDLSSIDDVLYFRANDGIHGYELWAYEYNIGKKTIKSVGSQDGWVLESSENSNKGGTMNKTANLLYVGDNKQDKQYGSFLSFNTSGLPDNAKITNMEVKVKIQGFAGGNMFNSNTLGDLLVDIRSPYFGKNAKLVKSNFQKMRTGMRWGY